MLKKSHNGDKIALFSRIEKNRPAISKKY